MRLSTAQRFLWGLYALASTLIGAKGQSSNGGPHEAPETSDFLRRIGSRAVVIGDYIYFDGGALSEKGYNVTGRYYNTANSTLSIDLSKSWTPSDVSINEIPHPRDRVSMNRQAILTDNSSDTFYVWGGGTSYGQAVPDPVLWKFTVDGQGGGEWTTEDDMANADRFRGLERTQGAAYASTPEKGFVFGGDSDSTTSPDPKPPVSGYATFDFDTKTWSRESSGPYTREGTLFGATATYVPGFGPNGIIMILGGVGGDGADDYLDFETLHFMDPETGAWHTQKATGQWPQDRATHCAVGVAGDNGTYEIFVYAGEIRSSKKTKRDMHVLSLPGFRWTKLPDEGSTEKRDHACAVVGNRQMLVWGGLNSTGDDAEHWNPPDPHPQGIGIYDLSEWRWKDRYDADADAYVTHADVASWYDDDDGLASVRWSSAEVEDMFTKRNDSSPGVSEGDEGGSSVSTGTIAGAVVGGVVGLALLGGLAWFFLRRRRRNDPEAGVHTQHTAAAASQQSPPPVAETGQGVDAGKHPGYYQPYTELDHHHRRSELGGTQAYTEMDTGHSSSTLLSPRTNELMGTSLPAELPPQKGPPAELPDTSRST